jgi:hypothetical protein
MDVERVGSERVHLMLTLLDPYMFISTPCSQFLFNYVRTVLLYMSLGPICSGRVFDGCGMTLSLVCHGMLGDKQHNLAEKLLYKGEALSAATTTSPMATLVSHARGTPLESMNPGGTCIGDALHAATPTSSMVTLAPHTLCCVQHKSSLFQFSPTLSRWESHHETRSFKSVRLVRTVCISIAGTNGGSQSVASNCVHYCLTVTARPPRNITTKRYTSEILHNYA